MAVKVNPMKLGGNWAVRFGVGSRDGPKSGVWRRWTPARKSDVYIAIRSYTGIMKVSLHESGECFVALTEQFAERNPTALVGRSRRFDQWKRVTHAGSQL